MARVDGSTRPSGSVTFHHGPDHELDRAQVDEDVAGDRIDEGRPFGVVVERDVGEVDRDERRAVRRWLLWKMRSFTPLSQ